MTIVKVNTLGLIVVIVVFVIWILFRKRKHCPKCDNKLPGLRTAKNFRQYAWGGWTCEKCGSEVDRKGKLIKK